MAPTHRRTAGVSTSSFIGRTCLQTKLADQKFMRLATATERAQSPVRAPTDIHPLSGRLQISGLLPTVPVGQRTVRQKYRNRLATKQIPPCNSGPRTASSFLFFLFFFFHRTMMTGPLLLFYYVTKSRKSASLLFIGCFFSSCSSMAAICGQLRTAVTHTVGHTATPPIRVEEKKRENKCRQGRREWPTNHFQQSLGTAQTQSTEMKEKKQLVLERHVGGTRRTAPAEFAFTPAVSQFPHRRTRSGIKPLQHEICWHFLSP